MHCGATLGDRHPSTLTSIGNLALLLHHLGEREAARPLCEEALAGFRATLGDRHPDTLTSINNLALLLKGMGHRSEALALLRELRAAEPPYAVAVLKGIRQLEDET